MRIYPHNCCCKHPSNCHGNFLYSNLNTNCRMLMHKRRYTCFCNTPYMIRHTHHYRTKNNYPYIDQSNFLCTNYHNLHYNYSHS